MMYYTYYYGVYQQSAVMNGMYVFGKTDVSISSEGGYTPTQVGDLYCPVTLR